MQATFTFAEDGPVRLPRPERLFFALVPDAETTARVVAARERLASEVGPGGRPLRPDRLHISLHGVGEFVHLDKRYIRAAREAGRAVSIRPFEVALPSVMTFGRSRLKDRAGPRPLVLLAEGDPLLELHGALGAAMRRVGLRAGIRFTPHMTLLYGARPIPARAIDPIRFSVREFVLVRSMSGRARYDVVDRWPLAARASGHDAARGNAADGDGHEGGATGGGARGRSGQMQLPFGGGDEEPLDQ